MSEPPDGWAAPGQVLQVYVDGSVLGNPGLAAIGVHVPSADDGVLFAGGRYLGGLARG